MSSTRQKLLACCGVLALTALPLACVSESQEETSSTTQASEAPGCGAATLSCEQGELCKLPTGTCDRIAATGACFAIPTSCPMILQPVCGCDGITYNNACFAMMAGVNLAYERACGQFFCGGTENVKCGAGQYCATQECGGLGFCFDKPASCDKVGTPVCGCDRQTYATACDAHLADVPILALNACPVAPWVPSAAPVLKPVHSLDQTIPRPAVPMVE